MNRAKEKMLTFDFNGFHRNFFLCVGQIEDFEVEVVPGVINAAMLFLLGTLVAIDFDSHVFSPFLPDKLTVQYVEELLRSKVILVRKADHA